MGLDLTLLPIDVADIASHTVLTCQAQEKWFDYIATLPALEVPKDFRSYVSRDEKCEESHYGMTDEDSYGEPLKYTTAKEILATPQDLKDKLYLKNKAILSYLSVLPEDTKVALYWN